MTEAQKLPQNPIHLGLGATSKVQPPFSGMEWYMDYAVRNAADGAEGRLVSWHNFNENWDVWEMHPKGSEVVICVSGEMTLIQEIDGEEQSIPIGPGEYIINPPGVWHTADVETAAGAIFITAGEGTEHRPRKDLSQ